MIHGPPTPPDATATGGCLLRVVGPAGHGAVQWHLWLQGDHAAAMVPQAVDKGDRDRHGDGGGGSPGTGVPAAGTGPGAAPYEHSRRTFLTRYGEGSRTTGRRTGPTVPLGAPAPQVPIQEALKQAYADRAAVAAALARSATKPTGPLRPNTVSWAAVVATPFTAPAGGLQGHAPTPIGSAGGSHPEPQEAEPPARAGPGTRTLSMSDTGAPGSERVRVPLTRDSESESSARSDSSSSRTLGYLVCKLVGRQHAHVAPSLRGLRSGQVLVGVREKGNPHDPCAIAVYLRLQHANERVRLRLPLKLPGPVHFKLHCFALLSYHFRVNPTHTPRHLLTA